jgi:NAD(P)-dependent dehydrogenase (short-subunit alcohol dehydrogenase family)
MRLDGRVLAITGAASGIGRAAVDRALAEGAAVAAIDRSPESIDDVGDRVLALRCDVSDPADVDAAFAAITRRFGRLDGFVASAGIGSEGGDCLETSVELWEQLIAVNLTGVFLTVRRAVELLRAGTGGSIVLIASQLGLVGTIGSPGYCASKGGVIALGRALALDHAAERIRVNVLCPGPVDTPMFTASSGPGNLTDLLAEAIPLHRIAEADEIAATIAFLLSSDSSYMTGSIVAVDGGWTAR